MSVGFICPVSPVKVGTSRTKFAVSSYEFLDVLFQTFQICMQFCLAVILALPYKS